MPAKIKPAEYPSHFWSRVKQEGKCFVWTGSTWDGYGSVGFRGKVERTHRVAWILTYGLIPKNKCVLHKCDNPPCVRPSHLFVGSRLDNNRDREAKGRGVYTSGEDCSWSKLRWGSVRAIRKLYGSGHFTMKSLADMYEVDVKAVFRVIHHMTWKEKGGVRGRSKAIRSPNKRS